MRDDRKGKTLAVRSLMTMRARAPWSRGAAALLALLALSGCYEITTTPLPDAERAAAAPRQPAPYVVQIGDLLGVKFYQHTELDEEVRVRPDGKISLPLLNEVQAAGLTPSQLRTSLMSKLVEYMPTPEVSVIVREVHSNKISVLGEVRKAGRFEISQRATVLDAVALAGGFNDFARRTKLVIVRQEASGTKRIPINYNRIVADEDDNVILQPGDIVVVP